MPPCGKVKHIRANAPHIQIGVYCADGIGWMDADLTNNILPAERHITVAQGLDFSEVSASASSPSAPANNASVSPSMCCRTAESAP